MMVMTIEYEFSISLSSKHFQMNNSQQLLTAPRSLEYQRLRWMCVLDLLLKVFPASFKSRGVRFLPNIYTDVARDQTRPIITQKQKQNGRRDGEQLSTAKRLNKP